MSGRNDVTEQRMALETIELNSGESPQASVIILHGLGADGNDFVPLVDQLDLSVIGAVRFIFPHAPERPVTINGGMEMRAWYDVLSFERGQNEDVAGLRESQAQVSALIERERERGIDASRIVLMGFSQGCAMTLMTGLRYPERLAGLGGLSGYLPLADQVEAERTQANADVPIFLAHGTADPIIPVARGRAAQESLDSLGYAVEYKEYSMPHSVCPQEIGDINRWLNRVLGRG